MTFDIKITHPLYDAYLPSWRTMRDAVQGEDDVKARGELYLPMKTGMRAIDSLVERNRVFDAYKARAEFPEIVSPTITGQVGLMNAQPPTIELPTQLEPLREQATPDGLSLDELVSRVSAELLTVGRYGLFPTFSQEGRPYIAGYSAESIINWDTSGLGLSYVVLDESGDERNPETNRWEPREQYRELRMNDRGVFESVLWTRAGASLEPGLIEGARTATTSRRAVDFMPFVLMGTRSLTVDPDDVPLYGLAKIALRIYRLDADYMQGLHMTSEPTPWISGFEDPIRAQADGHVPNAIGASTMWVLPPNGACGFLEFSGPGLAAQRQAIDVAREAAATFGARMFDQASRAQESGTARQMRYMQETSSLKTIANVAASGVERALRNHARWLGLDPETVTVTPNLDWVTDAMTPQELAALVKAWQDGAISYQTLFDRLQAGKVISAGRSFEEETKEIVDDVLRQEREEDIDPMNPEGGAILRTGTDSQSEAA